jgi:catalase
MPKALPDPMPPEITQSPALSLMARPGEGGIRTRKVAILAANGSSGASITAVQDALLAEGAVPTVVAPRIGMLQTSDDVEVKATGSLENSPPVLFDGVVVADGQDGVDTLARLGQTLEFLTNQYRHCKTMLALGASGVLFERAGVAPTLPSGDRDAGVVMVSGDDVRGAAQTFIDALAKHRHPAREMDPPPV